MVFVGYSETDVGNILRDFFLFSGFAMESGVPTSCVYATGSAAGRVVLGGFSNRKKFEVRVWVDATNTLAQVESVMSGASGGLLGVIRERGSRDEFKSRLEVFLQQFAKK